ncbi:MAG: Uma2 family endonuclease [Polyangiaceae bacterium]
MLQASRKARRPRVVYEVPQRRDDWVLSEEERVPESRPHDLVTYALFALLEAWIRRTGMDAIVCRNLAIRWEEDRPAIGVDPDLCVISPAPPDEQHLISLRTWETGHYPPLLAIEIVSPSRADKDYDESPLKYAANGTAELIVFDPWLKASRTQASKYPLQVFRRDETGDLVRVYAGDGPAFCETAGAWFFVVNEGRSLRIAGDEAGTSWWMTQEEAERAAKEAERAAKEAERAAKEAERAAKEEAQQRAERLAEKLRALGIDPATIA